MTSTFLAAIFALTAAAAWGTGDFASGLAARRVGALHTLLLSFVVGLVGMTILAFTSGQAIPSTADLAWGVIAGLCGTTGFIFMLRGFTVGRMSIVAPVSAVLAAAIPVIVTSFGEGLPRPIQFLGFGVAFISIWLVSSHDEKENRPAGIGLAILAGLGFGLFFSLLDQISEGVVYWPLVASRVVAGSLLFGYLALTRQPIIPANPPYFWLFLSGILDVAGNLFFLLSIQAGRLDIGAVLVSLYPAITVLLALLIAKEKMNRLQAIGVAVALLAIVLITL